MDMSNAAGAVAYSVRFTHIKLFSDFLDNMNAYQVSSTYLAVGNVLPHVMPWLVRWARALKRKIAAFTEADIRAASKEDLQNIANAICSMAQEKEVAIVTDMAMYSLGFCHGISRCQKIVNYGSDKDNADNGICKV